MTLRNVITSPAAAAAVAHVLAWAVAIFLLRELDDADPGRDNLIAKVWLLSPIPATALAFLCALRRWGRPVVVGVVIGLGALTYLGMFSIGPYVAPIVLLLLWTQEAMGQDAQPPARSYPNPVAHFARVWFSPRGEISRRTYWLAGIIGFFAFQITVSLLLLWFDLLRDMEPDEGGFSRVARNFLFYVLTPYATVAICAKRARDMGRSGWWGLALLIPAAGAALVEVAARGLLPYAVGAWLTAVQPLFLIVFGVLKRR